MVTLRAAKIKRKPYLGLSVNSDVEKLVKSKRNASAYVNGLILWLIEKKVIAMDYLLLNYDVIFEREAAILDAIKKWDRATLTRCLLSPRRFAIAIFRDIETVPSEAMLATYDYFLDALLTASAKAK